jgi:type II secretion system protein I
VTSRSRSLRGFTLVEVLLALSILAFGLVSVMVARGRAVETAVVARNLKIARLLAENLLAEIESGLREDLVDGMVGDFAEQGLPAFEWRVFIGEDSVAAASEAKDDQSLAGYYAEKEADRRRREDAGEEIPPEPTTPVAVRVSFPTLAETKGSFLLEGRVDTNVLEGKFDEAEGTATADGEGASLAPRDPSAARTSSPK